MACFCFIFAFKHHGPHGANRCAIAAVFTAGLGNGPVVKGGDHTLEATPGEAQDSYAQPFLACPDAFAAEYTLVRIIGKNRAARIYGKSPLNLPEPLRLQLNTQMSSALLELAGTIGGTVGAIHWMAG